MGAPSSGRARGEQVRSSVTSFLCSRPRPGPSLCAARGGQCACPDLGRGGPPSATEEPAPPRQVGCGGGPSPGLRDRPQGRRLGGRSGSREGHEPGSRGPDQGDASACGPRARHSSAAGGGGHGPPGAEAATVALQVGHQGAGLALPQSPAAAPSAPPPPWARVWVRACISEGPSAFWNRLLLPLLACLTSPGAGGGSPWFHPGFVSGLKSP